MTLSRRPAWSVEARLTTPSPRESRRVSPAPEVVEPRLPAPLQDVQDVHGTVLDEVLLDRVDEARRGDAIPFRERIDRVDQDQGPARQCALDELVRLLDLRKGRPQG